MRKVRTLVLVAVVGLPVVALGVVWWPVVRPSIQEYLQRIPFDFDTWKAARVGDWRNPVRLRMVDDLVRRHRLVGMSKDEIGELLGRPDGAYEEGAGAQHRYWLGPQRSFISIDDEWLHLTFEGDRVVRAVVRAD